MDTFLGVSHAPTTKGQGPSAPQFWGFSYTFVYTLCRRTTKFDVVTHMGGGLFLGGQPRPPSQGGVALSGPQFCGFSTYAYMV